MDFKIIWSPRGLETFQDLVDYISRDNPAAARRFGLRILGKVSLLAKQPQLGMKFQKLDRDDVREIAAPPYRIIYRVHQTERAITVLTVWHGARQEPEIQ